MLKQEMMTHQEDILLCLALLAPVSCWWITSGLSWVTCMVAWQSRLGKGAALQEAATPQIKAATEKSMDSFNRSTSQMSESRLARVNIKVWDFEPEDLVPGWQAMLADMLWAACLRVRSVAVRRGCTQIVVEVEVPQGMHIVDISDAQWADMILTAVEQQQGGVDTPSRLREQATHFGPASLFLDSAGRAHHGSEGGRRTGAQLLRAALQVTSGGRHAVHEGAAGRRCTAPPAVVAVTPAVMPLPGGGDTVTVTLRLSASLEPGAVLLARHCAAGYLEVVSAKAALNDVTVMFVAPPWPGQVLFEVLGVGDSGMLGASMPLLMAPTAAAADELAAMQMSGDGVRCVPIGGQPAVPAVHPVIADVGRWLDNAVMLHLHAHAAGAAPCRAAPPSGAAADTCARAAQCMRSLGDCHAAALALDAARAGDMLFEFFSLVRMRACCEMVAVMRDGRLLAESWEDGSWGRCSAVGCCDDSGAQPLVRLLSRAPQRRPTAVSMLATAPMVAFILFPFMVYAAWTAVCAAGTWLKPLSSLGYYFVPRSAFGSDDHI